MTVNLALNRERHGLEVKLVVLARGCQRRGHNLARFTKALEGHIAAREAGLHHGQRGYGAGVGGVAALLAVRNSCAPGVAVVNSDNGFGDGYLANLSNRGGATDDGPEQTRAAAEDRRGSEEQA